MRKVHVEHALLDYIRQELKFPSDRYIADLLGVGVSAISKIRHGATISADIILRIHEETGIPVKTIKEKING